MTTLNNNGRPKVLIVEDEMITAEDLKEILQDAGYVVCSIIPSGEEAVAKAPSLRPDIVLMDIGLAGEMDGAEAAARITSIFPVPVVFLTAFCDANTLDRAKKVNPHGYLTKPYVKETVRTTIAIALNKNHSERKLKDSFDWLRMVFRNMNMGILTLDGDEKITMINPQAELYTGLTLRECRSVPFRKMFTFHDEVMNVPYVPDHSRVFLHGAMIHFASDIILVTCAGKTIRFHDGIISPIHDNDGIVRGSMFVFTPENSQEILMNRLGSSAGSRHPVPADVDNPVSIPPCSHDRLQGIQDTDNLVFTDLSHQKANLLIGLGKFEMAESVYEALLQKNPGREQTWFNLGELLIKLGRFSESLEAFDKALEINPDFEAARQRKGTVRMILSRKKVLQ